ncbi:MAG TPA: hypothetical protein EYP05_02880, partial [Piscirickettsiaceae bacterium]|nr:hypothetical protein [Piscirickettsiaceae bacterium]
IEEDAITIMSIHAAKGLEFEHLFVIGLEEEFFPLNLFFLLPTFPSLSEFFLSIAPLSTFPFPFLPFQARFFEFLPNQPS